MVVTKVEEKLLQAKQGVRFRKEIELDELPDVTGHLHLGFYVDLILLPNLPPLLIKLKLKTNISLSSQLYEDKELCTK